jgi:hypothetical protein
MKKSLLVTTIFFASTGLATGISKADPMTPSDQSDTEWRYTPGLLQGSDRAS